MNLIEFPDDKVAFDPNAVTAIKGETPEYPQLSCPPSCPDRDDSPYSLRLFCSNSNHESYPEYTVVTVGNKNFTIRRPFHDVMLAISAHLLDNQTDTA